MNWGGVTLGIKACWRWITPECEQAHGSYEKALELALDDLRQKFAEALPHWGGKARFHVVLTIEPLGEEFRVETMGPEEAIDPNRAGVVADPNRPNVVATNGIDPDATPGAPKGINPATGQHESYWTLSAEERQKGFIRPVRRTYTHTGIRPEHQTRPLTESEAARHASSDYVAFEPFPENDSGKTGRYWTQKQLDSGCGATTTMSLSIAQTYAREPGFYGSTFCASCKEHLRVGPDGEFTWEDGTKVGT